MHLEGARISYANNASGLFVLESGEIPLYHALVALIEELRRVDDPDATLLTLSTVRLALQYQQKSTNHLLLLQESLKQADLTLDLLKGTDPYVYAGVVDRYATVLAFAGLMEDFHPDRLLEEIGLVRRAIEMLQS